MPESPSNDTHTPTTTDFSAAGTTPINPAPESAPNLAPPTPHPLRQGWEAAKANFIPSGLLTLAGLTILLSYYYVPFAHRALNHVADLKDAVGIPFAIISTAIFGGLLPLAAQQLASARMQRLPLRQAPFLIAFWAFKGFEIDMLYRAQAMIFGEEPTVGVVIVKVLVDQGIYVPLWAAPSIVLAYLWKDSGYSFRRTRQRLDRRWYRVRVLPMLLANWAVWYPAVAIIYCLPLALQLPIQNIVLCLWVLIVIFLTTEPAEADDVPQTHA